MSERVVLLDEEGACVGAADKALVHHADTPLHLAFSCYLFDSGGNLLLTRRALDKKTFPGVWTNSCCGHPAPGERLDDAVRRRVQQELGVVPQDLRLVLPRFRYRAEHAGIVENEMCPVYVAVVAGPLSINPAEVAETRWEPWAGFRDAVLAGERQVSAWCREQLEQLPADLLSAPAGAEQDLPAAARDLDRP